MQLTWLWNTDYILMKTGQAYENRQGKELAEDLNMCFSTFLITFMFTVVNKCQTLTRTGLSFRAIKDTSSSPQPLYSPYIHGAKFNWKAIVQFNLTTFPPGSGCSPTNSVTANTAQNCKTYNITHCLLPLLCQFLLKMQSQEEQFLLAWSWVSNVLAGRQAGKYLS